MNRLEEAIQLMAYIKDTTPSLIRVIIDDGASEGVTLDLEVRRLAKWLEMKGEESAGKNA